MVKELKVEDWKVESYRPLPLSLCNPSSTKGLKANG
jgi:hypothetical protein